MSNPNRRAILLRAINVGGTAQLPMAELRALAEELGATDVSTYIASGNLLCTAPATFDTKLERAITERFGFTRDIISRTRTELEQALADHPFEVADPKSSFVSFMAQPPSEAGIAKAETYATGEDRWTVLGRDLHIRYAASAGQPQVNIATVGKALGQPGTARNLRTVSTLIDLLNKGK
ncbi:MAG: DUF1697 domain-containing protein [Microbacteriaceae bacterium]